MKRFLLTLTLGILLMSGLSQQLLAQCSSLVTCNSSPYCYPNIVRVWIDEPLNGSGDYWNMYNPGYSDELLTIGRNEDLAVTASTGNPAEGLRKVISSIGITLYQGTYIPAKDVNEYYPCHNKFLEFVIGTCFESGSALMKPNCAARVAQIDASTVSEKVAVYPNPSKTGIFNLTSTGGKLVEVHNSFGEKVQAVNATDNVIDLTTQPNGMYVLKIAVKGKIETHLIVLSK